MPRLMSVALTEQAVVERRKTVTRRKGWTFLTPDTEVDLCRKVMGRKKGEPLVRVAHVRVIDVRRELLSAITDDDVLLEGVTLDALSGYGCPGTPLATLFCRFFVEHMGGGIHQEVTRIEWEYLDDQLDDQAGVA